MPWCPKCKTEYRKGFTTCSDCNTPLVEKLVDEEEMIPFFQAEEKRIADKLVRYFEYSGLSSTIRYYEDNQIYVVSVPAKKQAEAKKLYQAFYFVEREKAENDKMDDSSIDNNKLHIPAEENDAKGQAGPKDTGIPMKAATKGTAVPEDISTEDTADAVSKDTGTEDTAGVISEDIDTEGSANEIPEDIGTEGSADEVPEDIGTEGSVNTIPAGTTEEGTDNLSSVDEMPPEYNPDEEDEPVTYMLKSEQYKDLNATFWIFFIFGIAGILILVLNLADIFNFINGAISNIVMGALFIFFLYVALSTHHKARKVQAEIEAENKLTEEINRWLTDNITEEFLSSIHIDSISSELNYMRASETIHEMMIKEFGPQNNAYLDRLFDDYYNRTFDHMP